VVLKSYAKLNLYLEVLSRRKDKYHNLKTLFARIDLSDRITLSARRDKAIRIHCANPGVPPGQTNLCFRSAKLLQDKFGIKKGLDIRIEKRIPVGAGLGGGSGNAAAVLVGLNQLWKLNLSKEKLARLGSLIGADVPFFIYDTPFALGQGRGDKIRPLKQGGGAVLWQVLVVPGITVSTPLIYKKWDEFSLKKSGVSGLTTPRHDVKMLLSGLRKKALAFKDELLFNSLEPVTVKLYPEVRRIREKLASFGLKSILMSGSGPAVFGIVTSKKEAVSLVRKLQRLDKPWQVFATRTL
jgi:4-diphosphocytidyl-2-C-methyl-D-erythritol kinase